MSERTSLIPIILEEDEFLDRPTRPCSDDAADADPDRLDPDPDAEELFTRGIDDDDDTSSGNMNREETTPASREEKQSDKKAASSSDEQQAPVPNIKPLGDTSKDSKSLRSSLYADEFIAEVDSHYYKVACIALFIWIFLVAISFLIGKHYDALVRLEGVERKAPLLASLLLGMSLVSCVLPLLVKGNKRCLSGVVVCAVMVQTIAFITDILMATVPTPVFYDPMSGEKCYILRYCEWTPLSFIMAFLTESCRIDDQSGMKPGGRTSGRLSLILGAVSSATTGDSDHDMNILQQPLSEQNTKTQTKTQTDRNLKKRVRKKLRSAYYLGVTQGLSTFCGWLFPFCTNVYVWLTVMCISVSLFSILWRRLWERKAEFAKLEMGTILSEQEMYNWSKLSLGLLKTCTYVWSILVCCFFVCNFGPLIFPDSYLLGSSGLSMLLESTLDVLFKAIYLLIVIDVHDTIFDPGARAERRLEELRQMLSVVWDNSSDVIGISVRGVSGDVTTMLSPTYMKIYCDGNSDQYAKRADIGSALAFELDARCFKPGADENVVPAHMYDLHFKTLVPSGSPYTSVKSEFLRREEIMSISKLVVRSWKTEEPKSLLMHDLVRKRGLPQVNIRCEANITRMEENALVIVVRDISERFKRFEAEKKVISETTARLKDAAANRFTRHEVKNGLLAAIGLCDSLNESVTNLSTAVKLLRKQTSAREILIEDKTGDAEDANDYIDCADEKDDTIVTRYLFELDKTLHEILDTILAEAMARDVIHEVYEPKLERVYIPSLLAESMNLNANKMSSRRFPITACPSPLPNHALDPQLLKYIHRNAISNACKYGKKGGIVATIINYKEGEETLIMEVVNLPGEKHDEILKLGNLAQELVFSPRRRLTMHCTEDSNNQVSASHSSGDGAWIMHKCAKTLGGTCGIKFEEGKTTFSFTCPVKMFDEKVANTNMKYEDFELPKNIYAIAIDDSKIQRKLMTRFFMYAGIPEDRIIVLGENAEEIIGFCDWSVTFVDEHPDDYILMVVDENLDVQEEHLGTKQTTVSGSGSVREMRRRLLQGQEKNIIALIRSANDSASDVAIYNSRAHGYLPKAPIKKNNVLEVLAPLWLGRFPRFEVHINAAGGTGKDASIILDEVVITMDDLMGLVDGIDSLSLLDPLSLREKWSIVWEKLHALKGDLLIMPNRSTGLDEAISLINDLRGPEPPEIFYECWKSIRSKLMDDC